MKNKIKICILILSILILGFVLLYITFFSKDKELDNENKKIMNTNFESRIDKLSNFQFENMFTVGWLQVQGTNIDLPIFTSMLPLKEENNELKVDFSYGWRSSEYVMGENRIAYLGHNILNVSSNPLTNNENLTDFEDLMKFVYYDFAKDNLYIKYTEGTEESIYVIYAVGFYDYSEDYASSINDQDELTKYIENVKNKSLYNYDVDINHNDQIISIITCTRFFGLNKLNQFKIDARKLRENEETYYLEIKENNNYDEIKKMLKKEIS